MYNALLSFYSILPVMGIFLLGNPPGGEQLLIGVADEET